MREVLLTSSVLIAALLGLRWAFRGTISRRAQYALWGLVLVRLLLPVSLPAVDFSVLTAAAPVVDRLENQAVYFRPASEQVWAADGTADRRVVTPAPYRFAALAPASRDNVQEFTDEHNVTHRISYDRQIRLEDLLRPVWAAGAGAMALWTLAVNLRLWIRLRRRRIPLDLPGCRYRTYLVEGGLPSPCLFGLFRPAVYLTPAAMATDESLRHVLAHETTHARHLDPLWGLLRCVCLALYWFDPLVWAAAWVSRTDCELACDEGALSRLGEAERIGYGQTLLRLIPVRRGPGSPLLTATTMTADKRRLRERITRIAQRRQTRLAALCGALALAGIVCACTFTGAKENPDRPLTAEDLPPAGAGDAAARPAPRPAVRSGRELVLTIPLSDLEPYVPDAAGQMAPDEAPVDTMGEILCNETLSNGANIVCYWDLEEPGGKYWAVREGDRLTRFCREDTEYGFGYGITEFSGLFGHDGFVLCAPRGAAYTALDYYYLDGDGVPRLLADCANDVIQLDWDGDGADELAGWYHTGPSLYFRREGTVYRADIAALVAAAWPEAGYIQYGSLDDSRSIPLTASVTTQAGGVNAAAFRELAFDGENLLLYRRDRTAADHLSPGVEGPEPVLAALKEQIGEEFEMWKLISDSFQTPPPDGASPGGGENVPAYDDWRIESLTGPFYEEMGGAVIVIYRFNYELHTTTPERVAVAGGMYLDEDGWKSPGYPDCEYIYFLVSPDGTYQYLFRDMQNDCVPGDELFRESLVCQLRQLGVEDADYSPELETDERIPLPVREAAVQAAGRARQVWQQLESRPLIWDDQRLTALEMVSPYDCGELPEGLTVEVYNLSYELHAANPEDVILAGGMYVWAGGWVGGWTEDPHMLVFQVLEDGSYVQLESRIPGDVFPGGPGFPGAVAWTLVQAGVMEPSDASAEALYDRFYEQPLAFLEDLSAFGGAERRETLAKLLTCPGAREDIARGEGDLWDSVHKVQRAGGERSEGQQAVLDLLLELMGG